MSRAYLDTHTATSPFPSTVAQMLPFYKEQWGSLRAPHQKGQELFLPYQTALNKIFSELGALEEDAFFFYPSGAEAVRAVFLSHYIDSVRETGQNHFVTAEEVAFKGLEKLGCVQKVLPVNGQGQITQEMLHKMLGPRTSLVSLSWANGLTGVIHPVADLAQVCQEKKVRLHVDASYVIGKLSFRYADLPIDFLTFDGPLLHSPAGTGGLLVKSDTPFRPFMEEEVPSNIPGVVALATALEENTRYFDHLNLEIARLRDLLEERILSGVPGAVVFFKAVERLPNCCAVGFPGVFSEALLYLLHRKGVYATRGDEQGQKLSSLLIASGIDPELAHTALSFSLSYATTAQEIEAAAETIIACATQLGPQ